MYAILKRANRVPRSPIVLTAPAQVLALPVDSFYGLDIETRGLAAEDPASEILGIGLASDEGCYYVDLRGAAPEVIEHLKKLVTTARLTVFNSMFDCTFLQVWTGIWPNVVSDSYALAKSASGEGFNGQSWSLDNQIREVLGWPVSNKTTMDALLKERRLTKGDLWQLAPHELGEYCALDAEAAWQLHHELMSQLEPFPQLKDYHERILLPNVRLLAEQQIRGMKIDQSLLKECHAALLANIDRSLQSFLSHPQVSPHIEARNKAVHEAWSASEPARLTAKGEESARWRAWKEREASWMADRGFNPNSKQQLAELFYGKLGNKARKFTETGRQVVDRKVLPTLGEPGKLLNEYGLLVKRRGYVEATIEKSNRDGLIHPQFNSVGTVTLRLSGSGGWNGQQMPKVPDFLAAIAARPGHKFVQADAEALEPTILAEFSQDKTLLALYGKDAKQQDIYLYTAAKIPALGKEILKYYDPENPTPEGIKAAKKHCKRDRNIAKTVVLAANYNAGPTKIHETLVLGGIDISLREVREIHAGYWRLYSGVKQFERTLGEMWAANEGWIPSVLGTPICVDRQYLKDITNRFCQTGASLILQLWIYNVDKLRRERGVTLHPIICNFHDEMIYEAPEDQTEAAAQILRDALAATNEELGMGIPIKGPPMIADNLGAIKCGEDYNEWLAGRTT